MNQAYPLPDTSQEPDPELVWSEWAREAAFSHEIRKTHTQKISPRQGVVTCVIGAMLADLPCFLQVPPVSPSATSKAIDWQQHRSHLLPQFKGNGSTRLQQPQLRGSGKSPAWTPSPSRFQTNCKSFPDREGGGCLGHAPQAGLSGEARVPVPWVQGSPCLLSSRRTGGSCIT